MAITKIEHIGWVDHVYGFFGWVSVPAKKEEFRAVLARHDLKGLGFALSMMGFGWNSVLKRGMGFKGGWC